LLETKSIARFTGLTFLSFIAVGILTTIFVAEGIDINLSADPAATAENMLQAETRLRAKAYLSGLGFSLNVSFALGLFFLLKRYGMILAAWCLVATLTATFLSLMGAVHAMNAAEFASRAAYQDIATEDQRLLLTALQATSDYTAFHLGLVLSSIANAGFFYLFLRSNLIPRIISGWGVFASLFVASTVVLRDFIPALGSTPITLAFMLSNMIALVSLGVYLSIWGVRTGLDTPGLQRAAA
ncbi:MAG: DUF4386 domain-containing protein, partial [Pseudomonadota bacterium]